MLQPNTVSSQVSMGRARPALMLSEVTFYLKNILLPTLELRRLTVAGSSFASTETTMPRLTQELEKNLV